jgi:hypothetical protein
MGIKNTDILEKHVVSIFRVPFIHCTQVLAEELQC